MEFQKESVKIKQFLKSYLFLKKRIKAQDIGRCHNILTRFLRE